MGNVIRSVFAKITGGSREPRYERVTAGCRKKNGKCQKIFRKESPKA